MANTEKTEIYAPLRYGLTAGLNDDNPPRVLSSFKKKKPHKYLL